jgi:hypothetical protein
LKYCGSKGLLKNPFLSCATLIEENLPVYSERGYPPDDHKVKGLSMAKEIKLPLFNPPFFDELLQSFFCFGGPY